MSLTTLQVFSQYLYTTRLELLSYNIDLFNAATKGALVLKSAENQGDFADSTFYSRIPNLVKRRNAYATGALTAKEITMLLATSVKIAAGTNPVNIDPHFWQWIQRNPEEAGVLIGTQLAQDQLADMVGSAIKAIVAATVAVGATVVFDGTAALMKLTALNSGAALFGDRAQNIGVWLTHSKPMFDLFGANLTNTEKLFLFGTVQVVNDGFGRPFIVTDSADLTYVATGTKYRTLGLVANAAVVEQNNDYIENVQTNNGQENIGRTFQAQWSYNLGLKGFQWDKTNGGKSPNDAAIALGTNWDKVATNIKDLPGVIVNTQ